MKTLPLSLAALTLCSVNAFATGGRIEVLLDGSTLVAGTSGIWTLSNPSGVLDVPAGTFGKAPVAPAMPPRQTNAGPNTGPARLPVDPPKPLAPKKAVDPVVFSLASNVAAFSAKLEKSQLDNAVKDDYVKRVGAVLQAAGCRGAGAAYDCGQIAAAAASKAATSVAQLSNSAGADEFKAAQAAAAKAQADLAAKAKTPPQPPAIASAPDAQIKAVQSQLAAAVAQMQAAGAAGAVDKQEAAAEQIKAAQQQLAPLLAAQSKNDPKAAAEIQAKLTEQMTTITQMMAQMNAAQQKSASGTIQAKQQAQQALMDQKQAALAEAEKKAAAEKQSAASQLASGVTSAVNAGISAVGSLVKPGAPSAAAAKAADPKEVKAFLASAQQAVTIAEKLQLPADQAKPVEAKIVNALRMAGCASMTECPGANAASLQAGTAELKQVEPILAKLVADKSAAAKLDTSAISQIAAATGQTASTLAKIGEKGAAPSAPAPVAADPILLQKQALDAVVDATVKAYSAKPADAAMGDALKRLTDLKAANDKAFAPVAKNMTAAAPILGLYSAQVQQQLAQLKALQAKPAAPVTTEVPKPVAATALGQTGASAKPAPATGTTTPTAAPDGATDRQTVLMELSGIDGHNIRLDALKRYLTSLHLKLEPTNSDYFKKIETLRASPIDHGEIAALLNEIDATAYMVSRALEDGSNIPLPYPPSGPGLLFYNGHDLFAYVPKAPPPPIPTPTPTPTPIASPTIPNNLFLPPNPVMPPMPSGPAGIAGIDVPAGPAGIGHAPIQTEPVQAPTADLTTRAVKACTDAMTDAAANKALAPATFIANCVADVKLAGTLEFVSGHKAAYLARVKEMTSEKAADDKARQKLPDLYAPKLEKLNAKLEAAKLNKRAKTRLADRVKAFADMLKNNAKLTPEDAETRFDKLTELADEAIANAKEQGSTAAGLEKRLDRMQKRLERQEPAARKEFQAKLDAVVQAAGCRLSGGKLDCGETPPAALEAAGEKLDALGEELGAARKAADAGKSPAELYERKLGRFSRKLESPKLAAPAKAKIQALIDGFKKSLNDPAKPLTAEQAEEAFQKLSDDVDAASEKP